MIIRRSSGAVTLAWCLHNTCSFDAQPRHDLHQLGAPGQRRNDNADSSLLDQCGGVWYTRMTQVLRKDYVIPIGYARGPGDEYGDAIDSLAGNGRLDRRACCAARFTVIGTPILVPHLSGNRCKQLDCKLCENL